MEGSYVLTSFYANVCRYFSGKCVSGKCSLVRKHKENLQSEGDFSITLNIKALQKHGMLHLANDEDAHWCQSQKSEEMNTAAHVSDVDKSGKVSQDLLQFSNNWPLEIAQCSLQYERLHLYLNKLQTFKSVLHCILSQVSLYGKLPKNQKKIWLTVDSILEDEWSMNMTDYRKNLVSCVLKNILVETGHTIMSDIKNEASCDNQMIYHVSSNSSITSSAGVFIHCGAVNDTQKKCKERDVVAKDYLRQKCEELKEMSRQKHGQEVDNDVNWERYFRGIGEATLRIDLLSIRPSRCVSLNFQGCQETSRNAHFILYNCARLSALQEKFSKECSENIYPPIVPLEDIDFSLLVKEEEWELLSCYLLVYPHVLLSTIELLDKGKPMPNLLCQFLSSLCGCYSSYYRRVRVLTEPREHLLPVMFARLYLLKAVECVLHNGLRLLGIEPVRYM